MGLSKRCSKCLKSFKYTTEIQIADFVKVTHWNHPHFHAYFTMANSYPAVCADIIASGIGGIGFTWVSSLIITRV